MKDFISGVDDIEIVICGWANRVKNFALGHFDPSKIPSVVEHLTQCEECRDTLAFSQSLAGLETAVNAKKSVLSVLSEKYKEEKDMEGEFRELCPMAYNALIAAGLFSKAMHTEVNSLNMLMAFAAIDDSWLKRRLDQLNRKLTGGLLPKNISSYTLEGRTAPKMVDLSVNLRRTLLESMEQKENERELLKRMLDPNEPAARAFYKLFEAESKDFIPYLDEDMGIVINEETISVKNIPIWVATDEKRLLFWENKEAQLQYLTDDAIMALDFIVECALATRLSEIDVGLMMYCLFSDAFINMLKRQGFQSSAEFINNRPEAVRSQARLYDFAFAKKTDRWVNYFLMNNWSPGAKRVMEISCRKAAGRTMDLTLMISETVAQFKFEEESRCAK